MVHKSVGRTVTFRVSNIEWNVLSNVADLVTDDGSVGKFVKKISLDIASAICLKNSIELARDAAVVVPAVDWLAEVDS
jgi:hypothetical protein